MKVIIKHQSIAKFVCVFSLSDIVVNTRKPILKNEIFYVFVSLTKWIIQ